MSSLEIDLSVTSAGTGGIGAPLPARLGLRQQPWRSNPSGRQWLNHPLKRVKVESNYTQLAAGGPFRHCPPVTAAQKTKAGFRLFGSPPAGPATAERLATRQQKVTKVFQSSFASSRQSVLGRKQKSVFLSKLRKTILFRHSVPSLNSVLLSQLLSNPVSCPPCLFCPSGSFFLVPVVLRGYSASSFSVRLSVCVC